MSASATPQPSGAPAAGSAPEAATASPSAQPPATAVASAANPVIAGIGTVTVKRGDSLWRISRNLYGHGQRYSVIYDANTAQIRDPDLIYPDQIFVVPDQPN
jgi:nucleoid-associated protein YgaU